MVYPNPAPVDAMLSLQLPRVESAFKVILRDLAGREVYHQNYESTTAEQTLRIPTAGLVHGVYTVELQDANSFVNVWRAKVIIE